MQCRYMKSAAAEKPGVLQAPEGAILEGGSKPISCSSLDSQTRELTWGESSGDKNALLLGTTLTEATAAVLNNGKSPSRKVNEIDNRGTHYYIAKYWAEAMAKHNDAFVSLAEELSKYEDEITSDLIDCQGKPQDIGGYYMLEDDKANATMRPSAKFNELIDSR